MILDQRVIHQTTDISTLVNDYRTGSYTFAYQTGQYLYIGSLLPFNNLWFEVGTPNAVAATVSVSMWWGHQWVSAVDVIDGTSGLFNTGRIQWNTDIDEGWDLEQRASDVTGLSTFEIYNMYWARLSWSANLTPTMTLKYIGQKFSTDSILYSFYPDLQQSALLAAFASGKTTWDEQHYMATDRIIGDLKKRNIIKTRSQLLDYSLFSEAGCHKVAEILYKAFGLPYDEQRAAARKYYDESLNVKFFNVDIDATGRLDPIERDISTGFMTR